ncbi:hypothetical protein KUTeg_006342 [Tegillarca granosa]|uniref:Uncharacterized protein n=1 Tax=Tegillarca granosa TaxID=220873 RepID=A0ABQ9FG67_TEGGR|nr:hypothetical protein KUTeg_006342 [Tegillarca granosa]
MKIQLVDGKPFLKLNLNPMAMLPQYIKTFLMNLQNSFDLQVLIPADIFLQTISLEKDMRFVYRNLLGGVCETAFEKFLKWEDEVPVKSLSGGYVRGDLRLIINLIKWFIMTYKGYVELQVTWKLAFKKQVHEMCNFGLRLYRQKLLLTFSIFDNTASRLSPLNFINV